MESITYSFARQNLATAMKKVCDNHDPIVITNKREQSVVMISLDDFEALQETTYLLRSPKNSKRLLESILQLENEKGKVRVLVSPYKRRTSFYL